MSKFRIRFLQPILIVVLALVLLLSLFQETALAQSTSQLSSRISRLEGENSTLRSRLSRLESQVGRSGSAPGNDAPPTHPSDPLANASPLTSDPMFNRLATLVIELRERIIAVENQLGIEP